MATNCAGTYLRLGDYLDVSTQSLQPLKVCVTETEDAIESSNEVKDKLKQFIFDQFGELIRGEHRRVMHSRRDRDSSTVHLVRVFNAGDYRLMLINSSPTDAQWNHLFLKSCFGGDCENILLSVCFRVDHDPSALEYAWMHGVELAINETVSELLPGLAE